MTKTNTELVIKTQDELYKTKEELEKLRRLQNKFERASKDKKNLLDLISDKNKALKQAWQRIDEIAKERNDWKRKKIPKGFLEKLMFLIKN